jgi:hypothetical protein
MALLELAGLKRQSQRGVVERGEQIGSPGARPKGDEPTAPGGVVGRGPIDSPSGASSKGESRSAALGRGRKGMNRPPLGA